MSEKKFVTKLCPRCNQVKFEGDFGFRRDRPGNLRGVCKSCANAKGVDRRKKLPPKVRQARDRRYNLRAVWGDENVYREQVRKRGEFCRICDSPPKRTNSRNRSLAIDHNHETGVVRGLLCIDCNLALGKFKDSITLLEKAKQYLNG